MCKILIDYKYSQRLFVSLPLNRMWIIRKFIAEMTPVEAMNTIRDRLVNTRSNEEFLMSMNG